MERNIKVGEQVHVKNDQNLILGEVAEEIEEAKYIVDYKQGKMFVHDVKELLVYPPKIQIATPQTQKRTLRSSGVLIYRKLSPNINLVYQEDKAFYDDKPDKRNNSKLKKVEEKKQRKQIQKLVFSKLENNPSLINPRSNLTLCGQLSILIDKFNQFLVSSWSNKSYKELITSSEVQRLALLLSLQTKLEINQLLDEWLIERFIVIRKDMKQFKLQKYKHIQKLFDLRYKQILKDLNSEQFYNLDVRQQRRKYIIAKIRTSKLDIYDMKL